MHKGANGDYINGKNDTKIDIPIASSDSQGPPDAAWKKSRSKSEDNNVSNGSPRLTKGRLLNSFNDVHQTSDDDEIDRNMFKSSSPIDRLSTAGELHNCDNIWEGANIASAETLTSTKSSATPSRPPSAQLLAKVTSAPRNFHLHCIPSRRKKRCCNNRTSVRRSWSLIESSALSSTGDHHFYCLKKSPSHGGIPINVCPLDITSYKSDELHLRLPPIDVETKPCSCSPILFPLEDTSATSDQESVPRSRKRPCSFVSQSSLPPGPYTISTTIESILTQFRQ